jgi:hypothetical protein
MKENTQNIDHLLFNQLSGEVAGRLLYNQIRQARVFLSRLTGRILPTIFATLTMGVILFIGITLFLYQLAEQGW